MAQEEYFSGRAIRKVTFPDFFLGVKCPGRNFHFGRPQTNFSSFKKWNFPFFYIFHLPLCTIFYNFPSFILHFPFSPLAYSSFPGRSAKISQWKASGRHPPPPPPPLHHWASTNLCLAGFYPEFPNTCQFTKKFQGTQLCKFPTLWVWNNWAL